MSRFGCATRLRQITKEHELDCFWQSRTRPCSSLCFVSAESGSQPHLTMAEGDQRAGAATGVSPVREEVLGKLFWATGYLALGCGTNHRRDDPGIHRRARRRTDRRRQSISNQSLKPPRLTAEGRLVRHCTRVNARKAVRFWKCKTLMAGLSGLARSA